MKNMKKLLSLLLSLSMLACIMTACGSSGGGDAASDNASTSAPAADAADAADAAPADDGAASSSSSEDSTVTAGVIFDHLYMYTSGSGQSDNYCRRLVYDQLFYIDDNTGEFTSDLVESYEWADDTHLTIVLKDGITFSDGSAMTGEDVLFSLQNYITNEHSEMEWYQHIDFDQSSFDGNTVNIVYSEVYGCAMNCLVMPVLSKAFCEAHPDGDDAWWYSPVGSGPYAVGEVSIGTSVEYILRDDYWNTEKSFDADRIIVKYYSDATAIYADYVSGNLDIILDLSTTQIDQLQNEANTEVVIQSANDVNMLVFNESTVEEWMRQAIAYAVDWDSVAEAAFGNLYMTATSHFATTFDAYTDHSGVITYDPDKAKEILDENGYDGHTLTFICYGGSTDEKVGEAIQFYLAEVGIDFQINSMDLATLIPALINGDGDCGLQNTAQNGNATKEVNTVVSTFAAGNFKIMAISTEEFNDLLAQGLNTVDPDERAEVYKQLDDYMYEHFIGLPINERMEAYCYNSEKIASMSLASIQRGGLFNITLK